MTNDFKDKLVAQVQQHNKELQNIVNPPPFYSRQDVEGLSAYAWTSVTDLVCRLDQSYHCIVSRAMYGSLMLNPVFYQHFTPVNSSTSRGLLGVLKVTNTLVVPFLTDAYSKSDIIFDRVTDSGTYILVPPDRQRLLK